LFPWSYVGAVVLSVTVGLALTWSTSMNEGRWRTVAATLLMLMLTAGAFGYLARGSSELNQCVVDDEFPLATNHVCSGY
jgi:high-affinity Fe2+/Pb2+ permease